MSGAHQIAVGAGTLAALWVQEWERLIDKFFLASSRARFPTQLVIHTDNDQVTLSLRPVQGEEVVLDVCSLQGWSRERLPHAAQQLLPSSRGKDAVTVLSCTRAVTGSLIMPQRARLQAGDIIRDHLRRKMPVPLDDLELGYEIREAAAGKLELSYLAVPKVQVERSLAQLGLHSSDIDALQGLAMPGATPVTVPYGMSPAGSKTWMRWGSGLIVIVALLAPVAAFSMQAWRQGVVLSELETQVISLTEHTRTSTDRLRAVYGMANTLERLGDIGSAPGVVMIWDEVARLLPDTSYLTAFEIKGSELHAEGLSVSTSDLIERLESSPHLHAASLTGPVVFDREHGKERFTLRALIQKRRFPAEEGD